MDDSSHRSSREGYPGRNGARHGGMWPGETGTAVLTGASSGLGRALAFELVRHCRRVVLVARRAEVLSELARELAVEDRDADDSGADGAAGGSAVPLPFDLTLPEPAMRLQAALAGVGIRPDEVSLLINNAGAGSFGPFAETDPGRLAVMQQLNVRVPMELSRWIVPHMIASGGGTIANVASVAAFSPGPLMTEYYADKAWLLSFGRSLDAEVRPSGVRVVTLCPGPFKSGFHTDAGMDTARLGSLPDASEVARRSLRAIRRGKVTAPIGVGSHLWSWVGPRLPWRVSRAVMHALQRRRLEG